MKAKEFETVCLHRMEKEENLGNATMSRYGVQGSYRGAEPVNLEDFVRSIGAARDHEGRKRILEQVVRAAQDCASSWQPLQSLPDFEGVIQGGRQFIFDCKVCGQASFPLDDDKFKRRQLRHMLTRDQFGAVCFLLIHFTERNLQRGTDPAQTWAFPVSGSLRFWQAFDRGEVKRITREHCEEYGVFVPWNKSPGGRTLRPDILQAVIGLMQVATS